MKYRVGDRVRIKSLDWYNKNKDNYGAIYAGNGFCFWKNMTRHCGEIMKITTVKVDPEDSNKGFYFMENSDEKWTDGMIEGLAEEEISQNAKLVSERFSEYVNPSEVKYAQDTITKMLLQGANIPNEYILKNENGNVINAKKIVLEKKKKEYPKTYEECCVLLGAVKDRHYFFTKKDKDDYPNEVRILNILDDLRRLLICRDAYWMVYGEENKLGKPWEPDYLSDDYRYCIVSDFGKIIKNAYKKGENHIFAFPTEEMRDAFYENFKELIEQCKELL